jgi:hypothetical protein
MRNYASLVLVDLIKSGKIALWTVSVTSTSAELTGAWVIEKDDSQTLKQIMSGRLILLVDKMYQADELFSGYLNSIVELSDFVKEAKNESESALVAFNDFVLENEKKYKEYMAIDKTNRKLLPKVSKKQLTTPEFFDWPTDLTLNDSKKYLESRGKFGLVSVASDELANVLIAARCLQFLISMWQIDETERRNKVYIEGDDAAVTILPRTWLEKLN